MKYEIGDKIIVLHTNEEGRVVDIINNEMVMIEVKGVRFPAYPDQVDFPYFKMFTEKRKTEKKKIFIDNVKPSFIFELDLLITWKPLGQTRVPALHHFGMFFLALLTILITTLRQYLHRKYRVLQTPDLSLLHQ